MISPPSRSFFLRLMLRRSQLSLHLTWRWTAKGDKSSCMSLHFHLWFNFPLLWFVSESGYVYCVCRLSEGERLNKVLDHPAFQADPIGSIFQHLQSEQPPVEEKPKKKTNTNGSKKRKNRKKGKAESMDFWFCLSYKHKLNFLFCSSTRARFWI